MRTCSAAFLIQGDHILLAKRSADREFYPDVWDAVGGHVEAGETPEVALVREVNEELGVRATAWRLVAVLDEPDPVTHGAGECHTFVVTEWEGEPHLVGDEHSELRWCSLTDLAEIRLADPSYPAVLAAAIAGPSL